MNTKLLIISATSFFFSSLQAAELTGDHKRMEDIQASIDEKPSPADIAHAEQTMKHIGAFMSGCSDKSDSLRSPEACKAIRLDMMRASLTSMERALQRFPKMISRTKSAIQQLENLELAE